MSLRARLLISLAVMLSVALLLAGVLLVGLTRVSLVSRVDAELQSVATTSSRLLRLADLATTDTEAGQRLAVMRLDRQGRVLRAIPSGFSSDPDPLPDMPVYPDGIPSSAYGQIVERQSPDGSMRYRVLVEQARPSLIVAIAAPLSGVEAVTSALVRTLLLVGILALGGLLLVAWVVVRRDLLPLERIAKAAEAIAGGDLSHRAGVPHDRTEVGRLGTAFDAMLDQIETSFAQQQAALDAQAQNDQRLRRFVADASHELRTPLTVVRGYADLYHAGGLHDPNELAVAMDRIGTESRRMGALVDDLLTLARLDQGRPIGTDPVDLSRIANDAVADALALEPDRPITGAIDPAVVVVGDEDRLRQVIGNLITNVRVHTPGDTPFEVIVRRAPMESNGAAADGTEAAAAGSRGGADGGQAGELRVVDHGPGIPDEHGSSVFDRFHRVDGSRSRDHGGAGLGLSIAASIVAAHEGVIWHQKTPGGGATFVIRLPLVAESFTPAGSAGTALTAESQPLQGPGSANGPTI
jgi:two-component system, OmpR family, sensor kinase